LGEVVFDPDEEVQQVVRLVFKKFEELGCRALGVGARPCLLAQCIVDALPGPIEPSASVIIVNRAPRRQVARQVPPLAASPNEVEDGVDDLANIDATWASTWLGRREQ